MATYGRHTKGKGTKGMSTYQSPPMGSTAYAKRTKPKPQPKTKSNGPPGDEGPRRRFRGY